MWASGTGKLARNSQLKGVDRRVFARNSEPKGYALVTGIDGSSVGTQVNLETLSHRPGWSDTQAGTTDV